MVRAAARSTGGGHAGTLTSEPNIDDHDNGPGQPNADQADADMDGAGDICDGDDVSCVAHAVAALSDAGAISSPQGETVVSIAAQSPCKTRP